MLLQCMSVRALEGLLMLKEKGSHGNTMSELSIMMLLRSIQLPEREVTEQAIDLTASPDFNKIDQ